MRLLILNWLVKYDKKSINIVFNSLGSSNTFLGSRIRYSNPEIKVLKRYFCSCVEWSDFFLTSRFLKSVLQKMVPLLRLKTSPKAWAAIFARQCDHLITSLFGCVMYQSRITFQNAFSYFWIIICHHVRRWILKIFNFSLSSIESFKSQVLIL